MSEHKTDHKKAQITNMYALLNSLLLGIDNHRRAQKLLDRVDRLKEKSKSNGKTALVEKFQIKSRLWIEDVKKTEGIKNDNLSTLTLIAEDVRKIVGDNLINELFEEIEVYEKHGVSKIEDTLSKIEDKTGFSNDKDFKVEKNFTIDNYFLDISITYGNIARGLAKTIDDLDLMIKELDEQIHKNEEVVERREERVREEAIRASTPDSPAVKVEPTPAKTVNPQVVDAQTVEEIELGMSFADEDYFNQVDGDIPEQTEEVVESQESDISSGMNALFGDVSKTQEEEPEEIAGIKP